MAMGSASNDAELRAMLKGDIQNAVDMLVDDFANIKQEDIIDRVVYQKYSPDGYERTYEFKSAWKTNKGNGSGNLANGGFEYDPNAVTASWGNYPIGLPQHQDVYGNPQNEELIDYIYQGHGGRMHMPARNGEKAFIKEISRSVFKTLFGDALSKAGVPHTASTGGVTITTT